MPYRRPKFRHEERSAVRSGERVRTVTTPQGHEVRLAYDASGNGRVVSVLHPLRERQAREREHYAAEAQARREGAGYSIIGRGVVGRSDPKNPGSREPVLFEYHRHEFPSHHIGVCDEACRRGRTPHAHRIGSDDPVLRAQRRARREAYG